MTALITRSGDGEAGGEVVVFDHPIAAAGTQLPAGTAERGEDWATGALREGREETGLPGLRVVADVGTIVESTPGGDAGRLDDDVLLGGVFLTRGHHATVLARRDDEVLVDVLGRQGWIPRAAFTDDVVRHLVQLETDAPAPDDWWVVTPDGNGLCWHCRWAPLDADVGLQPAQADWLSLTRDRLRPMAPTTTVPLPDHPWRNETTHFQYWAFARVERWFAVSWLAPDALVVDADDERVRRALVAARTSEGQAVVVSGDGRGLWNFPGGGREAGETVVETAVREVSEEACADVVGDPRLLGYSHVLHLDDRWAVVDEELQARFAADVMLRPWEPAFEIGARRVVDPSELPDVVGVWWQPAMFAPLLASFG